MKLCLVALSLYGVEGARVRASAEPLQAPALAEEDSTLQRRVEELEAQLESAMARFNMAETADAIMAEDDHNEDDHTEVLELSEMTNGKHSWCDKVLQTLQNMNWAIHASNLPLEIRRSFQAMWMLDNMGPVKKAFQMQQSQCRR